MSSPPSPCVNPALSRRTAPAPPRAPKAKSRWALCRCLMALCDDLAKSIRTLALVVLPMQYYPCILIQQTYRNGSYVTLFFWINKRVMGVPTNAERPGISNDLYNICRPVFTSWESMCKPPHRIGIVKKKCVGEDNKKMENARRARRHLQRARDLLGFGYIDSSHETRYKMKFGGDMAILNQRGSAILVLMRRVMKMSQNSFLMGILHRN